MTLKLLDYRRGSKKQTLSPAGSFSPPPSPPTFPSIRSDKASHQPPVQSKRSGPLDYPTISQWLLHCANDLERGRDHHPYTSLTEVFQDNGCTRIDDVARLDSDTVKTMAEAKGIITSVGLINRICAYAVEDVATVQHDGRIQLT